MPAAAPQDHRRRHPPRRRVRRRAQGAPRRAAADQAPAPRRRSGPVCTFYFESFETMLFQVQEMLLTEKGGAAQLADELAAYNPLIPQGRELVATVMFEIDDPARRDAVAGAAWAGSRSTSSSRSAASVSPARPKATSSAPATTARPPRCISCASRLAPVRRRPSATRTCPPPWAATTPLRPSRFALARDPRRTGEGPGLMDPAAAAGSAARNALADADWPPARAAVAGKRGDPAVFDRLQRKSEPHGRDPRPARRPTRPPDRRALRRGFGPPTTPAARGPWPRASPMPWPASWSATGASTSTRRPTCPSGARPAIRVGRSPSISCCACRAAWPSSRNMFPGEPSDVIEMLFGERQEDVAAFAAAFSLAHAPGSFFSYSSGTTNIVSRLPRPRRRRQQARRSRRSCASACLRPWA